MIDESARIEKIKEYRRIALECGVQVPSTKEGFGAMVDAAMNLSIFQRKIGDSIGGTLVVYMLSFYAFCVGAERIEIFMGNENQDGEPDVLVIDENAIETIADVYAKHLSGNASKQEAHKALRKYIFTQTDYEDLLRFYGEQHRDLLISMVRFGGVSREDLVKKSLEIEGFVSNVLEVVDDGYLRSCIERPPHSDELLEDVQRFVDMVSCATYLVNVLGLVPITDDEAGRSTVDAGVECILRSGFNRDDFMNLIYNL